VHNPAGDFTVVGLTNPPTHRTRPESIAVSPPWIVVFVAQTTMVHNHGVAGGDVWPLGSPEFELSMATYRTGNEPSRARLGSARCGSVPERAQLGSARPFHELVKEARLGSTLAREPARLGSRAIF
jgi:hypothetical protein